MNIFYEPDRIAVQEKVAGCLKQLGRSMSWEFRKVRKDGSVLWVRETARAVMRDDQPIVLVACETSPSANAPRRRFAGVKPCWRREKELATPAVGCIGPRLVNSHRQRSVFGFLGLIPIKPRLQPRSLAKESILMTNPDSGRSLTQQSARSGILNSSIASSLPTGPLNMFIP